MTSPTHVLRKPFLRLHASSFLDHIKEISHVARLTSVRSDIRTQPKLFTSQVIHQNWCQNVRPVLECVPLKVMTHSVIRFDCRWGALG